MFAAIGMIEVTGAYACIASQPTAENVPKEACLSKRLFIMRYTYFGGLCFEVL